MAEAKAVFMSTMAFKLDDNWLVNDAVMERFLAITLPAVRPIEFTNSPDFHVIVPQLSNTTIRLRMERDFRGLHAKWFGEFGTWWKQFGHGGPLLGTRRTHHRMANDNQNL